MSLVGDPSVVRAIPEGGLKRLHLHLVRDPDMVKHLSESMLDHPPSPHVLSASDVTDLLVADMMDAVVGMFEDITGRLDARKSARMKAQAALRRHARAQMRSNCEPIPRSEAIAAFSPPYRNPRQARAAIRHLKSEGLLVECKDGFLAITGAGYDFAFGKAA
jgi:hypothetical protein